MGRKDDYFVLTYDNVKQLCAKFVKSHKLFSIKIDRSCNKNSNSLYLRFWYCGDTTSLRISDHNTRLTEIGGGIRNLIIDGTIRTYAVYSIMCETGKELVYKNKYRRMDMLFEQIKSNKLVI